MDPKGSDPTDSEVFICASSYLHITRIFHANYNCKKNLKIPKGKSKGRQHNGQINIDNRTQQSTKQYIHIKLKIE
jgi:hypothetical protein